MPTRRELLGGALLLPLACAPQAARIKNPDDWDEVARAFTIDRSAINLNNAAVSPSPKVVQDALARHLAVANSQPTAHALWTIAPPQREAVRERIAAMWGVDAEEVAITRSASEGLQICQLG